MARDRVVSSAERPEPPPGPSGGAEVRPITMFRWGLYVSLGVLAVLGAAAAVYTTRAVLIRVLIALFIAVSLDPAVRMLTRRGMRRGLAVLLIFLVAGGLVAAFLASVIPAMVHQFQALLHDFPGYVATLQERSARFRALSDRFHLTSKVQGLLTSLPGQLGSGLLGFTRRLFGALFSTLTVGVLTVYFMADLPRLRHGVQRLFPKVHRARGAFRGATGVRGGAVRPDPDDRRDARRDHLRAGRAAHHRAMADHGDRGPLLRGLPAAGELRHRAAHPAAYRQHERR